MKWNEQLRRERLNRGWTQEWVAREIGANTYTVNRWENGRAFPSHFFRQQLSQLFGKSLEELGFVQLVSESEKNSNEQAHTPSAYPPLQEDGQPPFSTHDEQTHTPSAYPPLQEDGQPPFSTHDEQTYIPSALQQDFSHLYNRQISFLPMNTNEDLPLIAQALHNSRILLPLVLLLSIIVTLMTCGLIPLEMRLYLPQKEIQAAIPQLPLQFPTTAQATVSPMSLTSYEAEAPQNTLTGGAAVVSCPGCSGGERVEQIGRGGTLQFNNINEDHAGNYELIIYYTNGSHDRTLDMSMNSKPVIAIQVSPTGTWHTVGMVSIIVNLDAGQNVISFSNSSARGPDIDMIVLAPLI
jgi:transcriptional regulator with XRE-family HTH domain